MVVIYKNEVGRRVAVEAVSINEERYDKEEMLSVRHGNDVTYLKFMEDEVYAKNTINKIFDDLAKGKTTISLAHCAREVRTMHVIPLVEVSRM